MVYVDTRRDCWNFRLSGGKFFSSAILLGLAASVALSIVLENGVSNFFIAALISASVAKLSWEANGLTNSPFSLTPCFSWVRKRHENENRFNGLSHTAETVETVLTSTNPAATQLKQGVNESVLGVQSRDHGTFERKQSALLQRTVLRRTNSARFLCGAFGGIILPAALLIFSPLLGSHFVPVLAVAGFVLCLVGELLERHLFFTAVVAPKMPGGISP
jgi:hypothetical protein